MRIGSLRQLCAVAVAAALATPAVAQNTESTLEANQGSNAARGAAGEAGTVGPGAQPGATSRAGAAQPGATVRPSGTQPGAVRSGETNLDQPDSRTANYPPGQGQAQGQINDRALSQWILAGNEAEIRINELAQEKAQNEQVKQFAQKMIQDHTQFGDKLRQAAGSGAGQGQDGASSRGNNERQDRNAGENRSGLNRSTDQDRGTDRNQNRNEAENRGDDSQISFQQPGQNASELGQDRGNQRNQGQNNRGQAGMRGENPFVSLHQEIKEKCAQSTIQALREKEGAKFDHAFMHQQVIEHMAMLDTLQVAQNHASGELKQVLQQGEQTTQQHLQHAKQLLEQVENQKDQ